MAAAAQFGKTKTPPPVWQWGSRNSYDVIRTGLPRGKAARLATDPDSDCDSLRQPSRGDRRCQLVWAGDDKLFAIPAPAAFANRSPRNKINSGERQDDCRHQQQGNENRGDQA